MMFLKTHVSMDDAQRFAVLVGLGMGIGEPARHTANDEYCEFLGQHPPFIGQLLPELLQVDSANQLHRNKKNAAGFAK